ncbi:hypothetical protein Ciccas_004319 [Cichlidogyrus casuarinus]|uniref:SANT and BTB domain-containing protein n=1 Tax=Cichlidogyrus casuarinus TaxID=1844966 RepID=A0ABD2QBU6_9PLAT
MSEKLVLLKPALDCDGVHLKDPLTAIQVFDQNRNKKQKFFCPRNCLLEEMRFFKSYFELDPDLREITVQCDLSIFSWLIRYVKRYIDPDSYRNCHLNTSNVTSLMISSKFLQIDSLVSKCTSFIAQNLVKIYQPGFSIKTIEPELIQIIFSSANLGSLLRDDKLSTCDNEIFVYMISSLFDPTYQNEFCPINASRLCFCENCSRIFSLDSISLCETGEAHVPGPGCFNSANEFLQYCYFQLRSRRHLLLSIWAVCTTLSCSKCGKVCQLINQGGHSLEDTSNLGQLAKSLKSDLDLIQNINEFVWNHKRYSNRSKVLDFDREKLVDFAELNWMTKEELVTDTPGVLKFQSSEQYEFLAVEQTWRGGRLIRENQDLQRQREGKATANLIQFLTSQRYKKPQEPDDSPDQSKDFSLLPNGGLFLRIFDEFVEYQPCPISKERSKTPVTNVKKSVSRPKTSFQTNDTITSASTSSVSTSQ